MGPIIRILLRYLAGVLMAKGFLQQDDLSLFDDPQLAAAIEMAAGAIIGVLTEYWYAIAKRIGGKT